MKKMQTKKKMRRLKGETRTKLRRRKLRRKRETMTVAMEMVLKTGVERLGNLKSARVMSHYHSPHSGRARTLTRCQEEDPGVELRKQCSMN